jgi:hypothetical protein
MNKGMCGDKLISGSDDYTTKAWNTYTRACKRRLESRTRSAICLVVCDGKLIFLNA